jgi:hypothetical protein
MSCKADAVGISKARAACESKPTRLDVPVTVRPVAVERFHDFDTFSDARSQDAKSDVRRIQCHWAGTLTNL